MPVLDRYHTAGQIAGEANVPIWKIQYLIRSRGIIPADRVGVLRLFSESDRQFLLAELRRANAKGGDK